MGREIDVGIVAVFSAAIWIILAVFILSFSSIFGELTYVQFFFLLLGVFSFVAAVYNLYKRP